MADFGILVRNAIARADDFHDVWNLGAYGRIFLDRLGEGFANDLEQTLENQLERSVVKKLLACSSSGILLDFTTRRERVMQQLRGALIHRSLLSSYSPTHGDRDS